MQRSSIRKRKRKVVVIKFGGTSVGIPPERSEDKPGVITIVESIPKMIAVALAWRRRGYKVVIVASAMSGETDRTLKLVQRVVERAAQLNPKATPALIAQLAKDARVQVVPECRSTGLIEAGFLAAGVPVRVFWAHQIGITAESSTPGNARIKKVDFSGIRETLAEGKIAVVAGFQCVDEEEGVLAMGRGGSDNSATTVSEGVGADECLICTDVPGIFTTNPSDCTGAYQIARIPLRQMFTLATLGATVMDARAVRKPRTRGFTVCQAYSNLPGTVVYPDGIFNPHTRGDLEGIKVEEFHVSYAYGSILVTGLANRAGQVNEVLQRLQAAGLICHKLFMPAGTTSGSEVCLLFNREDLDRAIAVISEVRVDGHKLNLLRRDKVTTITIVGDPIQTIQLHMLKALAKERINMELAVAAGDELCIAVDQIGGAKAVQLLRRAVKPFDGVKHEAPARKPERKVWGIASPENKKDQGMAIVTLHKLADEPGQVSLALSVFEEHQIIPSWLVLPDSNRSAGISELTVAFPRIQVEECRAAVSAIKRRKGEFTRSDINEEVAQIAVVTGGDPCLMYDAFQAIAGGDTKFNIIAASSSGNVILFVVKYSERQTVIQALHAALIGYMPPPVVKA